MAMLFGTVEKKFAWNNLSGGPQDRAESVRAGEIDQGADVERVGAIERGRTGSSRQTGGEHAERGQLITRHSGECASRGETVEPAVQRKPVEHRLIIEDGDKRATVALDLQPPLALESDDCFPHGNAADANRLGDVVLGQPLAGGEGALEDQTTDEPSYCIGTGLPVPHRITCGLREWSRHRIKYTNRRRDRSP